MRSALLLPAAVLLAACGSAKAPTTGALAAPTQQQQAALQAANNFRNQAQLPMMTFNQALEVAAVRHAGYQAIEFNGAVMLDHTEPDTANALYTAFNFADRIRHANGGNDIYNGHVYYEGITSVGMPHAIGSLWNTVYHRLPLCRRHSALFGYGEEDTASTNYPEANVPDTSSGGVGVGYATTEYAGQSTTAVTASHWPAEAGVTATGFDPLNETPNPVSSTNAGQSPHMPDDVDMVGPPIHVIIPTSQDWASATITLAKQSTPATPIPVYVLIGYVHADTTHFSDPVANPPPAASTFAPTGSVTAWAFDVELDAGEIFVMAVDPLALSTGYQYRVQASAGTDSIDTGTIHFSTP
jgi:hypothetical protein